MSQTKERPILFNTDMVRAIMNGRKTQTRRVIKPQPEAHHRAVVRCNVLDGSDREYFLYQHEDPKKTKAVRCPYGQPGDLLWVRETFERTTHELLSQMHRDSWNRYLYKATHRQPRKKWKPSIFMPKDAARIWLQVKSVRVEQLKDISEEDAKAEGIRGQFIDLFQETRWRDYMQNQPERFYDWRLPSSSFFSLWESINGSASLKENPLLWVVEFDVLSTKGKPEAWKGKQLRVDEEADASAPLSDRKATTPSTID